MWRGLIASEKKAYEEEYAKKLAEYQEAKEAYNAENPLDLVALAKPQKTMKTNPGGTDALCAAGA